MQCYRNNSKKPKYSVHFDLKRMVTTNKQTHLSYYESVVSRTTNHWSNFHTEIHRSCMQRSLQFPANATIEIDNLRATLDSFKDPIN